MIENSSIKLSENTYHYRSTKNGFVNEIDIIKIGKSSNILAAGRKTKGCATDLEVGLKILVKVGDYVKKEQPLMVLYYKENLAESLNNLADAIEISPEEPVIHPIIFKKENKIY